ncbi:hypothetical protein Pan14r_16430 [Crateriforma conspicua]|uniref:Uncharacterized protein n=1 Tax=Crateriforma conspicua TaxID=2527996 RepID=A0A5C5Y181_9PLAN|nr:hypothetical protein Pan14r_16430 [Crateriforma conspicua]
MTQTKIDPSVIALLPLTRHDGTPVRIGRTMRRIERGTLVQVVREGNRLTLYILDESALENPPADCPERP